MSSDCTVGANPVSPKSKFTVSSALGAEKRRMHSHRGKQDGLSARTFALLAPLALLAAMMTACEKPVTPAVEMTAERPAWLSDALQHDAVQPRGLDAPTTTTQPAHGRMTFAGGSPRTLTRPLNTAPAQPEIQKPENPAKPPTDTRGLASDPRAIQNSPRPLSSEMPAPVVLNNPVRPAGPASAPEAPPSVVSAPPAVEPTASEKQTPPPTAPTAPTATYSAIEKLFNSSSRDDVSRQLAQFGYDFFEHAPQQNLQGPVDPGYTLGPGDEIQIKIWGSIEHQYAVTVDREGAILLPQIGAIDVSGIAYTDLEDHIRKAYAERFRDFQLRISMGKLRSFPVYVVGEVKQPGIHELSGRATVIGALLAAGGLTHNGTLRRIEIRRADTQPQIVDLYDFLLNGGPQQDIVLRPGDSVYIPVIGETVGIAGFVRRPGIYEIKEKTTVADLIAMAGGMHAFSRKTGVQIETTATDQQRSMRDIVLPEGGTTEIGGGEFIRVFSLDPQPHNVVEISGKILRPGRYEWAEGMRVSDLVKLAGPALMDAYLDRVTLSRQLGSPSDFDVVKDRVRFTTQRQVLYVNLRSILAGEASRDIALQPLDHLQIDGIDAVCPVPTIQIRGAVRTPGTYELTSGMTVLDAVQRAGGVAPDAYLGDAEIARRIYDSKNRTYDIQRIRLDLAEALKENARHNVQLQNLDMITVRNLGRAHVTVAVTGEVRFPGEYILPAGSRITDLLVQAGGPLDRGDIRAAVFTRRSVQQIQQARFDDLIRRTERELTKASEMMTRDGHPSESIAGKFAMENGKRYLQSLTNLQATGRVVIQMTRDDYPVSPENLTLEDHDRLDIPAQSAVVLVVGEVFNPAAVIHDTALSVGDYISKAGGMTTDANPAALYLIRSDGTVQNAKTLGFGKDSLLSARLYAGDSILVPPRTIERSKMLVMFDQVHLFQEWSSAVLLLSKSANLITNSIRGIPTSDDSTTTTRLDRLLNFSSEVVQPDVIQPLFQQAALVP